MSQPDGHVIALGNTKDVVDSVAVNIAHSNLCERWLRSDRDSSGARESAVARALVKRKLVLCDRQVQLAVIIEIASRDRARNLWQINRLTLIEGPIAVAQHDLDDAL